MRKQVSYLGLLGVIATSISSSIIAMPQNASAASPTCYLYQITITGTVSSVNSSQTFVTKEYALYRNAGVNHNPFELWIVPEQTTLNSSSTVGQIELLSNSILASNLGIASSRFDLESGVVVGNSYGVLTLISDQSFYLTNPNVFTAPGINTALGGLGGLANPYIMAISGGYLFANSTILNNEYLVPRQGQISFQLKSNQIVGSIQVTGAQVDNLGNTGNYKAQFSGLLINEGICS